MPAPVKRGERYMPGLDGLRAVAVLAVIAYHLEFVWAQGGLLGVGVFFTLSGYLITDILLAQAAKGGIRLKSFWGARARRLLPALFVMLVVVMAWVTVIGPHQPPDFRQAVASAAFYVNNWWLILHDVSYFEAFAAPEPLNHLWSLSVEEQFYIFWPLLVIVGLRFIHEAKSSLVRVRLAGVTLALAIASGILMLVLYSPSIDPSRVYYGTDTRALELLIGAALAMIWPSRRLQRAIAPKARRTLDAVGVAGLVVVGLMFWRTDEFSPFLYRGGFFLLAFATALVVAAAAHPASRLGPILGCRPMRWVGERSYGIYLWMFPIIILTTPETAEGPDLARAALQVAAIFAVAALSWKYVENPIRHGALGRMYREWRAGRWRKEPVPRRAWAVLATSSAVVLAATLGLLGVGAGPDRSEAPGDINLAETVTAENVSTTSNSPSCNAVVHIGDSTSEGLVSSEYLPDPKDLISARYASVGIKTQHLEVSGARSIYESFQGLPNAEDVAVAWISDGFDGCWVLALGTNEAANVSAGSAVGYDERIDTMMSATDGQPVLWVNVKTMGATGPYAEENMEAWNDALLEACDDYPNMRIYDWASDVQDEWFVEDGIHFTTPGYAARGKLIAKALAEGFPSSEEQAETDSSDCLIDPEAGPGGATST